MPENMTFMVRKLTIFNGTHASFLVISCHLNSNMQQTLQTLDSRFTLILGAEGELGRAFAREVTRKKCNLIIVSTTSADLQRFAIGLQLKEDVQVDAMKIDLADSEAVRSFIDRVRGKYDIHALVNNVTCDWSVAHNKCVSEIAREDSLTRFRGAAMITLGLLPHLKRLPSAYIQHVIPFPFKKEEFSEELQQAVGKMYAFSRELDDELKETGICVSMVHPAPIRNIVPECEVFDGLTGELNILTPRLIAMKAVNGMLRGDRLIIPGLRNKLLYYLNRQASSWIRHAEESFGSALQPSV
jgi:short-subunit dehydrogenase